MSKRVWVRAMVAGLVVGTLGACGFHPRAELRLPDALRQVSVDSVDPYSPLQRDVRAALERAGAKIVPAATEGVGAVRIVADQMSTEVLSASGRARVTEYTIRYHVEVEVAGPAGQALLARTPIDLTRDYSFDETQALGAAAEEDLIRKELRREMTQQVINRLETVH